MPPKKKKPAEPKQYVCMVPCWHNGHKYKKGQTEWFTDNYPKDSRGKLLHFEELSPGEVAPEPQEEVVTVTGTSDT